MNANLLGPDEEKGPLTAEGAADQANRIIRALDVAEEALTWDGHDIQVRIAALTKELQQRQAHHQETIAKLKVRLFQLLELFYPSQRYEGPAGTAQIVRPKPRVTYNTTSLEAVRVSSDEAARFLDPHRKESPVTPYLKVTYTKREEKVDGQAPGSG